MNKSELHIEIAPRDLSYASAIARFQVDMAMESEGISQVRLYVDKDNKNAQTVYQKVGMSECHYHMYEVEV